ncbi:hypothetical protein [Roseospira visakhapatnamensis]|uniref:Uncharacterized protein n=1 Tax=Roseospira visakhapatnamensis TaxID=390880 RepID=A0A7W6W916_9PROT|nr:hypothetical protein [Roseospira visakhapatnamensis]MBB4264962.1 hypothetical protein [Roseospira visakhapatnamensis]
MLTGREAMTLELLAYAVFGAIAFWKHRQLVREVESTAARTRASAQPPEAAPD